MNQIAGNNEISLLHRVFEMEVSLPDEIDLFENVFGFDFSEAVLPSATENDFSESDIIQCITLQ